MEREIVREVYASLLTRFKPRKMISNVKKVE